MVLLTMKRQRSGRFAGVLLLSLASLLVGFAAGCSEQPANTAEVAKTPEDIKKQGEQRAADMAKMAQQKMQQQDGAPR